MGTCVSTVHPRRMLGPRRKDDPKENTPLSNDKERPGEVNGKELPGSVNSKYLPDVHSDAEPLSDGIHNELLSNGIHSKHSPGEEHNIPVPDDTHHKHLPNDAHDKPKDVQTKRRALLVGITYTNPWNTWSQLDGPHDDVDQYQGLLLSAYSHTAFIRFASIRVDTYGYRPEDIVVLKDLADFPEERKPTEVNMVRDIRLHLPAIRSEIPPRFVSSKH